MKPSGVFRITLVPLLLAPVLSVSSEPQEAAARVFGRLPNGDEVLQVTLRNRRGAEVSLLTWGATLLEVRVPGRDGSFENVNLRLASLEDYLAGHPLFGSTVGRFANRIDTGGFTIGEKRYDLVSKDAKTKVHIHGGKTGFQAQNWKLEKSWTDGAVCGALLTLHSPDGHEGYPGNLDVSASFVLDGDNRLTLSYEARTDRPTHVNLTNHAYWNLGGVTSGSVLGHHLQIAAQHFLDFDSRKIPTGKRLPVEGTPLDFRQTRPVGERIAAISPGYDHCFVLDQARDKSPGFAARLEDPVTGRVMEIETSAPGIQLYTANHLKNLGYNGHLYGPHHGICLECQHFPDTPNRGDFPPTLLCPGQVYRSSIVYRFSVR